MNNLKVLKISPYLPFPLLRESHARARTLTHFKNKTHYRLILYPPLPLRSLTSLTPATKLEKSECSPFFFESCQTPHLKKNVLRRITPSLSFQSNFAQKLRSSVWLQNSTFLTCVPNAENSFILFTSTFYVNFTVNHDFLGFAISPPKHDFDSELEKQQHITNSASYSRQAKHDFLRGCYSPPQTDCSLFTRWKWTTVCHTSQKRHFCSISLSR